MHDLRLLMTVIDNDEKKKLLVKTKRDIANSRLECKNHTLVDSTLGGAYTLNSAHKSPILQKSTCYRNSNI